MGIKVIITGSTGMVGEGVLFECMENPEVSEILLVNRRYYKINHPKVKECIVKDLFKVEEVAEQVKGYDACFFCAGVTSVGRKEKEYTYITYDTTIHFAKVLSNLNPDMVFNYISGGMTDTSEKGKIMWARVKGKTENDLMKLPFKKVYNFRPGFMKPVKGQKNLKYYYKIIGGLYPVIRFLMPSFANTLNELGKAMINCVIKGYSKQILEIEDIRKISLLR
jgi:nucleoside-diphosphate-sugar epimerase